MNQRARQAAPFNERGILDYRSSTGYSGLANFVDDFGGNNGTTQRAFGNPFYYPSLYRQAYFVQDRWRASQSITLSLGLRYEYFGTPMNVIPAPAFTGLFNIDPVTLTGPFGQPNKISDDKNNFSPMIGLAYAPSFDSGLLQWLFGDRKTSSASGYGVGYDSYFNNITSNAAAAAPNNLVRRKHFAHTRRSCPWHRRTGVLSFPSLRLLAIAATKPEWNCQGSSQPLLPALVFHHPTRTCRRTGSWISATSDRRARSCFATEQLNPLVPVSLRASAAGFSASAGPGRSAAGLAQHPHQRRSSNYNSFQAEVKRRFANGFQFNSSYTWSKAIDNVSELFNYGNTASLGVVGDPRILRRGHARSRGLLFRPSASLGVLLCLRIALDEAAAQFSRLHRRRMAGLRSDGLRIRESVHDYKRAGFRWARRQ